MTEPKKHRYVVSVLVGDRVGILRDITSAVTDMDANIDGISQTVVEGYFTVILTAAFDEPVDPEAIRTAIAKNFARGEVSILVRPYVEREVARFNAPNDRYVLTITGLDRKGILKTVTAFLADKGINVEDWYVVFQGARVTHVGEISVPARLDIKQTQEEFQTLVSGMHMVSCIQHENIFRATNEIGPVKDLLVENPHAASL
jgi:predicted amino acid-binding ACT domain protein